MDNLRSNLLRIASSLPQGDPTRRALLVSIRKAREFDTKEQLEKYLKDHPKADPSRHKVKGDEPKSKKKDEDAGDEGSGTAEGVKEKEVKKEVEEKGLKPKPPVTPEGLAEFKGEIPEYKLEIIAGGEGGEITEADIRRAKAIKAQLSRGIQAAADVCQMSPPVCEGNLGVARSSMPQIMDKSVKELLASKDEKERKKGQAAVDAGADPNDDTPVMQQIMDSLKEAGVQIKEGEKRPVGQLKATQREIKAGKTYGMANAYLSGEFDPTGEPIIISNDNHILDGHHRYSAMITADPEAQMNVIVVDMPMKEFLERSFEQPGVFRADLQDNIIDQDDPLDLARPDGSTWQQKGKWYAKNKEGHASGPFESKEAAEGYASGKGGEVKNKKKEKSKSKSKKGSLEDSVLRIAAELPKGDHTRRRILSMLKESWGGMPTMPRSFYLPKDVRDLEPMVPEGTDLAIWTYEENGKLYAVAFAGKAQKPLWHYSFRSEAQRDDQIRETAEARRDHFRRKQERSEEKKQFQHGLQVGDILDASWGYDQTNVNFYEVTAVIGKMVEVREVAKKLQRSEPPQDYVVPVPGKYVGPPMKKLPQGSGKHVYIKINSVISAYPWGGKSKYQTSPGWGH